MGDKQKTSPQASPKRSSSFAKAGANSQPSASPPAKLVARRHRQAAALRENLAKRKRQGRECVDALSDPVPHPANAKGERDG